MPLPMIALSLHILAATFWAGSTFALARTGGNGGEQLFRPQIGAAIVAVLSGAWLWRMLHEGAFGTMEQLLAAGALSAIVALVVQAAGAGPALRRLRKGADAPAARSRLQAAHRVAAALLGVAIVAMAAARYA